MIYVLAPLSQAEMLGRALAWEDVLGCETDPSRVSGNATEFLGYAAALEKALESVPQKYTDLRNRMNSAFNRAALVQQCQKLWPLMHRLITNTGWVDDCHTALFARMWLTTTGRGLYEAKPYSFWHKMLYDRLPRPNETVRTICALHEARLGKRPNIEDLAPDVWDRIDWYVYQFSPDPKGGDNWGRNHRNDNLDILLRAMAAVEAEVLMRMLRQHSSREWIEELCKDFLAGQEYGPNHVIDVATFQLGARGIEFIGCFHRKCEREIGSL